MYLAMSHKGSVRTSFSITRDIQSTNFTYTMDGHNKVQSIRLVTLVSCPCKLATIIPYWQQAFMQRNISESSAITCKEHHVGVELFSDKPLCEK